MSDQLYCPECADKWSGAYNTDHRCVTCGSPLKAEASTRWVRPSNCRNELQSQGRPYPKSGCEVCENGGRAGCPYDMQDIYHLKAQWQAEALESVAVRYEHNSQYPQYCMHCILESEAGQLRHQSPEGL